MNCCAIHNLNFNSSQSTGVNKWDVNGVKFMSWTFDLIKIFLCFCHTTRVKAFHQNILMTYWWSVTSSSASCRTTIKQNSHLSSQSKDNKTFPLRTLHALEASITITFILDIVFETRRRALSFSSHWICRSRGCLVNWKFCEWHLICLVCGCETCVNSSHSGKVGVDDV